MNLYYIVSGVIVGLGILLFIFLALRKKYRTPTAAQNYENIRNKLTVRELEKPNKEVKEETHSGGGLGSIIEGCIVIMVGIGLLPAVSDQIQQAYSVANVTSSVSYTMVNLVTWFFVIGLVIVGLNIIMGGLIRLGIISNPFREVGLL